MMRAVLVRAHGPYDSPRLEDMPDPVPGEREVVIEARAIGVNYPDLLAIEGRYQRLPPLPFSPGKEMAGVVRAVGAGTSGCKPGDRVMALIEHGAYAELVRAPQQQVFVLPESIAFLEAAALGLAYQTAHFALLDRGQYRSGETVCVTGATGGVGLAALQVAKALGATVIAAVSGPHRAELARANGADHVIDLSLPDLRESLREQVYAVTGRRGVDVVIDPVGGDVFDAAMRALAWRGRMVVVGFASGRIPEIKANYLLVKNIAVSGLQVSDYRDRDPAWMRRVQAELFDLYLAGKIKPYIEAKYPLSRFNEALARFGRRDVVGKLMLVPDRA
ncbi:MAG TPA: NADPH:quinone oxidoreductase family protein [Burkholderiales bacterium]|nr:NADPH:quinone oxidoreductase family protein [Burkholderiales bacterium]